MSKNKEMKVSRFIIDEMVKAGHAFRVASTQCGLDLFHLVVDTWQDESGNEHLVYGYCEVPCEL